MGMLGHSHPPAEAPSVAVEEEVDEEAKKVQALQEELAITELTAEATGG